MRSNKDHEWKRCIDGDKKFIVINYFPISSDYDLLRLMPVNKVMIVLCRSEHKWYASMSASKSQLNEFGAYADINSINLTYMFDWANRRNGSTMIKVFDNNTLESYWAIKVSDDKLMKSFLPIFHRSIRDVLKRFIRDVLQDEVHPVHDI